MSDHALPLTAARPFVERFSRFEYREAFEEYRQLYGPAVALWLGSLSPRALCDAMLEETADAIRKKLPWSRSAARMDCKLALSLYLCPMLSESKEEREQELARLLCETWNGTYPKLAFQVSDHWNILDGFRHSVLGIDFANKHIGKED